MDIVLVRHGETALNKGAAGASAERIRGWTDVKLNTEGQKEADRLAAHFASRDVREIYASPLSRAHETAFKIAKAVWVSPQTSAALMPWQLGEFHGQLVDGVIDAMNRLVRNERVAPKGGEPFREFRVRFLGFLQGKLDEAAKSSDNGLILLVTHSRNLQATKAWAKAGFPSSLALNTDAMIDYSDEHGTGSQLVLKP